MITSVYGIQFGRLLLRAAMTILLLIVATVDGGAQTVTLEMRVLSGSDDAEERASGSVKLGSSDLELTFDGSDQTVGMRLTGLNIPPGATISNAYIQFRVDNADSVATSLTIGEKMSEDAATFVSQSGNISSRPRTTGPRWRGRLPRGTHRVRWARTSGHPMIAPVIQQIVNLPGWLTGNALVIIVDGTGERTADSFNGNPTGAPLLHVEYLTGPVNEAPTVTVTTPVPGSQHTVNRAIVSTAPRTIPRTAT